MVMGEIRESMDLEGQTEGLVWSSHIQIIEDIEEFVSLMRFLAEKAYLKEEKIIVYCRKEE